MNFDEDKPQNKSQEQSGDPQNRNQAKITEVGLWKRRSRNTGLIYVGGGTTKYWVNMFRNEKAGDSETQHAATLKFDPKSKDAFETSTYINLFENFSNKTGEAYLRGMRDGLIYCVYPNKRKQTPKAPDYNLCIYKNIQKTVVKDSVPNRGPQEQGHYPPPPPEEQQEEAQHDPYEDAYNREGFDPEEDYEPEVNKNEPNF